MRSDLQQLPSTHEQLKAGAVRIVPVEEVDALLPRKEEWNALVLRNRTNTIFQTFEWQVSWLKAFGDDVKPLILLAETDDELVGIAPLLLTERRLWGRTRRTVEFIGGESCDYCDFIVDHPDAPAALLRWLIENAHLWDLLHLSNLTETSPLVQLLPRFFDERGCRTDVHLLYECPTRIFRDPAEDRSLANKKSLKRHYNYFRRNGELHFKRCSTEEEAVGYLDLLFEQHIQRWSVAGFPSLFSDERNRTFYRELVKSLMPTGWLHFSVLSFNGGPIALHFGYDYDNRIYWIIPTFSSDHADHSPGEVLLKYSLEDAMDRNVGEFDFTVGEESYKYRFSNHVRLNYAARVYRNAISFHVDRLLLRAEALIRQLTFLRKLRRRFRRR